MGESIMLLDILIPTFNRVSPLEKNINLLIEYISRLGLQDEVAIIISDNYSSDNTIDKVSELKSRTDINISLLKQTENVGLEKNAAYILSKSKSKFVMYLGDDDFLQFEYFKKVISTIKNGSVSCIIPSFLAKTVDDKIIGQRSLGESKLFHKGFDAVNNLTLLGHQLSGVTFLREGTLEHYLKNGDLRNIYLFMSFVGFNCLRGDALLLTEYPVDVTVGEKKDWNYGDDGLFNEKIKNVPLIYNSGLNRLKLERKFYISNIYSIFSIYGTTRDRFKAIYLASVSKNLSSKFKIYLPLFIFIFGMNKVLRSIFKKIGAE